MGMQLQTIPALISAALENIKYTDFLLHKMDLPEYVGPDPGPRVIFWRGKVFDSEYEIGKRACNGAAR